jgi:hypothetical protein
MRSLAILQNLHETFSGSQERYDVFRSLCLTVVQNLFSMETVDDVEASVGKLSLKYSHLS